MNEQRIKDPAAIEPNHFLFRVYAGEAGKGLTDDQRRTTSRTGWVSVDPSGSWGLTASRESCNYMF